MVNQDALIGQIERTLNCEVETGPNGLVSSVYFPELVISNFKENRQHRITDLYVKIEEINLYGVRYSYSIEELMNRYCHSHLPRIDVQRVMGNQLRLVLSKKKFCIGAGELNKWLISHNSSKVLPEEFNFPFVMTLKKYLQCESTEGTPHMYISKIGADNVSYFSSNYYTLGLNIINSLLPVIKDSISVIVSNNQLRVIVDTKKAAQLMLHSPLTDTSFKRDEYFTYSSTGKNVRGCRAEDIDNIIVTDELNIWFKGRKLQYIYSDNLNSPVQEPERYIVKQLEKQIQDVIKSKILYHSSKAKRDEWVRSTQGNLDRGSLEKDTLALW